MICCLALSIAGALAILRGLAAGWRSLLVGGLALAAVGTPLTAWALATSEPHAGAPTCSLRWLEQQTPFHR
jgi:hypothetical protein